MHNSLAGPAQVPASRRRNSTDNSLGLDYQSTRPVDEDILSRIRALLLSRNANHPPSTPRTSEENPNGSPREKKANKFDFSTAKSIARLARKANHKVKPGITRSLSKSADTLRDRRSSQPVPPPTDSKRPLLRTSSSVTDFRAPYGNDPSPEVAISPSFAPAYSAKTPWIPKLVFQDMDLHGNNNSSRNEISTHLPWNEFELPEDKLACRTRFSPPKLRREKDTMGHSAWPGRELMAEPSDLVCFLAGCRPGQVNCTEHHQIPSITPRPSPQDADIQDSTGSRTAFWATDVGRYRHSGAGVDASKDTTPQSQYSVDIPSSKLTIEVPRKETIKVKPKNRPSPISSPPPTSSIKSSKRILNAMLSSNNHSGLYSVPAAANSSLPHPTAEAASLNDGTKLHGSAWKDLMRKPKFPTNDGIEEMTASIPSTVVHHGSEEDGLCLPVDSIPNVEFKTIETKQSDSSLKAMRAKSPSLLSGASQNSAYHHLLLRSSISEAQPVDTGLPVPPILTTAMVLSSETSTTLQDGDLSKVSRQPTSCYVKEPSSATNTVKIQPKEMPAESLVVNQSVTVPEGAENSPREYQGLGLVSDHKAGRLISQDISKNHSFCQERAQLNHTGQELTREAEKMKVGSIGIDGGNGSLETLSNGPGRTEGPSESKRKSFPTNADAGALASPTPSSQAAYWKFEPAIKEVVHDALNIAVRNVTSDATLPKGMEKEKAVRAYRRVFADSLAEATKDVDTYLRRPSLWNEPEPPIFHGKMLLKPCHRPTCLQDPHLKPCNFSCRPEPDRNPLVSVNTWRGHDCEVCSRPSDAALAGVNLDVPGIKDKVPEDLKSQPTSESAVDVIQEKQETRRNPSSPSRKDSAPSPSVKTPDRKSSKNRLSHLKDHRTNHPTASFRNADVSKRPYERLSSRSRHALRSVSSTSSLRGCPAEQEQPERLLLPQNSDHESENDLHSLLPAKERLGLKNTAHWLKGLLSTSSSYESKLTALPPRARRRMNSSNTRPAAQSTPPEQMKEQFPGATPNMIPAQPLETQNVPTSDGLSKTIHELEDLLNEALVIARKAADRREASADNKIGCNHPEEKQKSRSRAARRSDKVSQIESVHESLLGYSSSSDGSDSDDICGYSEHFKGNRLRGNLGEAKSYSPCHPGASKTTGESSAAVSRSPTNPPTTHKPRTNVPVLLPKLTPSANVQVPRKDRSEDDRNLLTKRHADKSAPRNCELRDSVLESRRPLIQPRSSSKLRKLAKQAPKQTQPENQTVSKPIAVEPISQPRAHDPMQTRTPYSHSLDGTQLTHSEEIEFSRNYGNVEHGHVEHGQTGGKVGRSDTTIIREREIELRDLPTPNLPVTQTSSRHKHHLFNLKNKRHVSLRDHKGFSLARSHKRQSIARDWSPGRKRFCAAVACISTALVGILVGIYAGETPAIQYWIVDFHHYTVLGNVFFFIGLSIPTFLFWPLPLLHGRKPYILGAMSLAMPLLFPQALAIGQLRSPYTHVWRVALILPRAFMGFCLGFANMNFKGILTDLFGASLQSTNPHQEHVDQFDVRRHGGGMGVWLGLWTWSAMGSIGVGFLIGAAIINTLNPAWGFYISITIIAFVLLLNILTPEVRRSAFRRSVAEVKNGGAVSRRLARGEVKMHMVQTGPKWWGEEFHYGVMLSINMLKQPGFMVMAAYVAWMYGQLVLIVLLLGSLCSNSYKFQSPQVGAAVSVVPLGAFVAIPFQKASLFSRDRSHAPVSDDDTYKKKVKWSSHFVRRAVFVLTLPFAGLGYALSSGGPPIPFILPILFAGLIGFLSNLAMAECHGIIMETYDTSDLHPGMTGRNRGSAGGKSASKRTNYSSFPRVSSAFGITQGLGYLIAAAASGVGGTLTRNLGQQAATGVMAFILLVLSILLLCVLIRFKDVQIIPDSKMEEMDRYHNTRRASNSRRGEGADEDEHWRPIIIGNPHHSTRRMCILELGSMSRFSEIRQENRLVDERSLEARHPNQQMMIDVKTKLKEKESEVVRSVRRSLSRPSSLGSRRSVFSDESIPAIMEQEDLGGHREIGNPRPGEGSKTHGSNRRRATRVQK